MLAPFDELPSLLEGSTVNIKLDYGMASPFQGGSCQYLTARRQSAICPYRVLSARNVILLDSESISRYMSVLFDSDLLQITALLPRLRSAR